MATIPADVTEAYSQHLVDELTYRSYRHQREIAPQISPKRWESVFQNVSQMEARYQKEIAFVRGLPHRCEARLARHSEDVYPEPCGARCEPGETMCSEHKECQ